MIKHWDKLVFTLVVAMGIFLFNTAPAEHSQIRATIIKEYASTNEQVDNVLRFAGLVEDLATNGLSRTRYVMALEHSLPTTQHGRDEAVSSLKKAQEQWENDVARLNGFYVAPNNEIAFKVQHEYLAALTAERDQRASLITSLTKRTSPVRSEDQGLFRRKVVLASNTLMSSVDAERAQVGVLRENCDLFIRQQDQLSDILAVKILLAVLLVVAGSTALLVAFLKGQKLTLS
jgi:hypothetical protein